jgi:circadian clock protein KaiC
LKHAASRERVSTGVPQLDAMLGGGGYYRGSSVLVSGTAGSGKSSLSAHFAAAACKRGERCVYFAFEESEDQVVRNMSSIGVDLATPLRQGKLLFHATRPTLYGLEGHLAIIHKRIREADPQVVIIDPISTFLSVSNATDVKALFVRLMDFLKEKQITAFFTSLTTPGGSLEQTDVGLSSLIDTWLLLRDMESGGERNRGLYVLKSRGMSHSNQVREFLLTDYGIQLVDVCLGPEGVLTGSARRAQAARERTETAAREEEIARQRRELDLRRQVMEARIATLRTEFKMEEEQLERLLAEEGTSRERLAQERAEILRSRQGGAPAPTVKGMDRTPTR